MFFCLKRWKNGFLGDFGGQKNFSPFWEILRGDQIRHLGKKKKIKSPKSVEDQFFSDVFLCKEMLDTCRI